MSMKQRHILIVRVRAWKDSPCEIGFATDLRRAISGVRAGAELDEDGNTELTVRDYKGREIGVYTFPGEYDLLIARSALDIDTLCSEMCNGDTGLMDANCFAAIRTFPASVKPLMVG